MEIWRCCLLCPVVTSGTRVIKSGHDDLWFWQCMICYCVVSNYRMSNIIEWVDINFTDKYCACSCEMTAPALSTSWGWSLRNLLQIPFWVQEVGTVSELATWLFKPRCRAVEALFYLHASMRLCSATEIYFNLFFLFSRSTHIYWYVNSFTASLSKATCNVSEEDNIHRQISLSYPFYLPIQWFLWDFCFDFLMVLLLALSYP